MIGLLQLAVFAAALVLTGWAGWRRNTPIAATGVLLVLNVLIGWAICTLTGSTMPLLPLIFLDTITAALILWFATRDEQVFIGWLLTVQVGIHIGTKAAGAPPAFGAVYSNTINAIGWGQILLLMIGTINGSGKRLRLAAPVRRYFGVFARAAAARVAQH